MFDHVHLRVGDLEESKRFYAAVLAPLGFELTTDRPDLAEFGSLRLSEEEPRTGPSTSPSSPARARTWTLSTGQEPRRATVITARRASAPMRRTTTPRTFSTLTGTTWRPFIAPRRRAPRGLGFAGRRKAVA